MPLELQKQKCKMTSFNPRAEMHGNDREPAADIAFVMNVESAMLAYFHPTLRGFLFVKHEAAAAGDLANQGADLPNLRMPLLKPLRFADEIIGAQVIIHNGLGGKSDIVLETVDVNNFCVDPKEGGTVILSLRVQGHPDERQSGKLCGLIQQEVELSIVPPAAGDAAALPDQA